MKYTDKIIIKILITIIKILARYDSNTYTFEIDEIKKQIETDQDNV